MQVLLLNIIITCHLSIIPDVFHWSCLNERESALPNNTAPGGYTCPTCYDHIIPAANLISPVADVLRSRLEKTTWGRDEFVGTTITDDSVNKSNMASSSNSSASHLLLQSSSSSFALKQNADCDGKSHVHKTPKDHSINMDSSASYFQSKCFFLRVNRGIGKIYLNLIFSTQQRVIDDQWAENSQAWQ